MRVCLPDTSTFWKAATRASLSLWCHSLVLATWSQLWLQLKEQREERRAIPASSWVPREWDGALSDWCRKPETGDQLGQPYIRTGGPGSYSSSSICLPAFIYRGPLCPSISSGNWEEVQTLPPWWRCFLLNGGGFALIDDILKWDYSNNFLIVLCFKVLTVYTWSRLLGKKKTGVNITFSSR